MIRYVPGESIRLRPEDKSAYLHNVIFSQIRADLTPQIPINGTHTQHYLGADERIDGARSQSDSRRPR